MLIGGSNRAYRLTLRRLGEIADAIAAAARAPAARLCVTPSRRTGEAGLALLRDRLAGLPASIWDGTGDNPYFAYLAVADAFLVTADLVSMVSEAAATGKPVHILELDGGDAKFARFHEAMREAGITRPFTGSIESWSYRRSTIPRGPARRCARWSSPGSSETATRHEGVRDLWRGVARVVALVLLLLVPGIDLAVERACSTTRSTGLCAARLAAAACSSTARCRGLPGRSSPLSRSAALWLCLIAAAALAVRPQCADFPRRRRSRSARAPRQHAC